MMGMYMPILASGGSSWTIGNALSALQETVGNYGKVIIGIIGLVMVIVSVYQIAKNLISHGKGQTNWVVTFALLLIGGALMLASGGTCWYQSQTAASPQSMIWDRATRIALTSVIRLAPH